MRYVTQVKRSTCLVMGRFQSHCQTMSSWARRRPGEGPYVGRWCH